MNQKFLILSATLGAAASLCASSVANDKPAAKTRSSASEILSDPVLCAAADRLAEALQNNAVNPEETYRCTALLMTEVRFMRDAYPSKWEKIYTVVSPLIDEAVTSFLGSEWQQRQLKEFQKEIREGTNLSR